MTSQAQFCVALRPLALLLAACTGAEVPLDAASAPDAEAMADGGGFVPGVVIGPDGAVVPTPMRVLFVGNSYTYVNDLPAVVGELAAAIPGVALEVEAVTQGGATLGDHWSSTGARDRIATGEFDVVVLQGQSVEPIASDGFHEYAALFRGALREADSRGVWFATWARRAGDPFYGDGTYTPDMMTADLEFGYQHAADLDYDVVARVGAAWQISLAEMPDVPLHADDRSHPSLAGTVLAGCVIVQALTGKMPTTLPALGIPSETAAALCAIAPRVRCFEGMTVCDDRCVNLERDYEHCGACGVACDGEDPCQDGLCGCDPGFIGCSYFCYEAATSLWNCGACGVECTGGELCVDSACICPSVSVRELRLSELRALEPECETFEDIGTAPCNAAAHTYCAALDCFSSGFGPPTGHAPAPTAVMCVTGDVRDTTYATLQTFVSTCSGSDQGRSQDCATAISRYCASIGAVSGFGPVQSAGNDLTLTCVSSAAVLRTTFEVLRDFASRCTADPVTCSTASWNFCESMGYPGGFGPVEIDGANADVVCLRP